MKNKKPFLSEETGNPIYPMRGGYYETTHTNFLPEISPAITQLQQTKLGEISPEGAAVRIIKEQPVKLKS